MNDLAKKLATPKGGALILLAVVLALGLILVAAYHGSDASTASECSPAKSLLRRTVADATALRATVATGGRATGAQVTALTHDDDDVNNFINGEQTPGAAFNGRVLPVADELGRVVTQLQASGTASVTDVNALNSAARAAGQYCGVV